MVTETANRHAGALLPADLLGEGERAALFADPAPALIIGADPARVLWASHAAARRLGFADGAILVRNGLPLRAAGSDRLALLARGLSEDTPARLERLRFNIGFRSLALTALCSPIRLAHGAYALKVALVDAIPVPEAAGRGGFETPILEAASVETPIVETPIVGESPDERPMADLPETWEAVPRVATAEAVDAAETAIADREPTMVIPVPDWLTRPVAERRPLRFVFTLDRDGHVETVAPAFGQAIGAEGAAMVGRKLPEIVADFDPAAGEALRSAIAKGETWSGLAFRWPLAGTSLSVPVDLSALPIQTAGEGLAGFSGFGRCHLDRVHDVLVPASPEEALTSALADSAGMAAHAQPASLPSGNVPDIAADAADAEQVSGEQVLDEQMSSDLNARELVTPEQIALELITTPEQIAPEHQTAEPLAAEADLLAALEAFGAPDDSAFEPLSPEEAPPLAPALVERDTERPEAEQPRADAAGPRPDPQGDNVVQLRNGPQPLVSNPAKTGLSMSERNAFREIARALGAKLDPDHVDAESRARTDRPAGERVPDALPAREIRRDQHPEMPGTSSPLLLATPHAPSQTAPDPTLPKTADDERIALIDRLPIGILVMRENAALFANRTLIDLTGYPDLATFVAEDGHRAIFRKGATPRAADGFDTIVLATREGEMIPVDAHLQIADWNGAPATLISVRRAIEIEQGKALRSVALDLKRERSEAAELRAILDTATDGVVTLDQDGRILSLNGAAEAVFGLDQNEVVGQSFTTLLRNESHSEALAYFSGLKNAGVKSVLNDGREVFGREKKGGRIPLFMTLGQISEGEPRRYCAVLHDLTAWKRAEAELTDARRSAEMASAKKSDFLTKISHEIRTPMNAIIGFAELMLEERLGPVGTPRYKDYLGDIRTSGRHVVSLVNDLLDLAKIEAGRMELHFAATDLNAIISSTVGIIQPQANGNRVLVRTQLASKLPSVVADERSIRQIVLNMLSNATRFTEAGGQVIIATALLDSGEAVIRIRDTGIGMTANDIEQALEPFRQVGTRRDHGGTGLGLPLTKALVEANRANFAIRSTPGEGTMIEITFPSTRVLAE